MKMFNSAIILLLSSSVAASNHSPPTGIITDLSASIQACTCTSQNYCTDTNIEEREMADDGFQRLCLWSSKSDTNLVVIDDLTLLPAGNTVENGIHLLSSPKIKVSCKVGLQANLCSVQNVPLLPAELFVDNGGVIFNLVGSGLVRAAPAVRGGTFEEYTTTFELKPSIRVNVNPGEGIPVSKLGAAFGIAFLLQSMYVLLKYWYIPNRDDKELQLEDDSLEPVGDDSMDMVDDDSLDIVDDDSLELVDEPLE